MIDNLRQYVRENNILTNEYKLITKTFRKYISNVLRFVEVHKKEIKSELLVFKKELDNEKKFRF